MKVSFQLTMPNVGSWDGKFSGANKKYYHTISVRKKKGEGLTEELIHKLIEGGGYFTYNFGDGWTAAISMQIVDDAECRRRTKISAGFMGYNWMVDSILKHGKIIIEPKTQPA